MRLLVRHADRLLAVVVFLVLVLFVATKVAAQPPPASTRQTELERTLEMNGRNGKNWLPMLVMVAALSPVASLAQTERVAVAAGNGKLAAAKLVEVKAKVQAIDLATREVTLLHEDGSSEKVLVSEEAKNLAQVKVGDMVTMQAYQSLSLALNKVEGAKPELSEKTSEQRAELGALPGGVKTHEIAVVAKVTAIDAKESVVTLTGPKGNSVELVVPPETLAKVKVGDHVNAIYTEALAVSVTRVSP